MRMIIEHIAQNVTFLTERQLAFQYTTKILNFMYARFLLLKVFNEMRQYLTRKVSI